MTYLRHASRHLNKTVEDRLVARLAALGWTGAAPPFGTTAVTVYSRRVKESELVSITGNIVGIFFGEESEDEDLELGGGNLQTTTALYVDIVAVNDPIGLALASDMKDYLSGRAAGTSRFFPVRDYTTNPAGVPTDYLVEATEVSRQRPENNETKLFWQVVVATLEMSFSGEA